MKCIVFCISYDKIIFEEEIMKKILILIISCLFLVVGCKKTTDDAVSNSSSVAYPKLKVVNDMRNTGVYIWKVELVNYKFEPLEILGGESQTFSLENGMPAENENIYIRVYHSQNTSGISIKKNFTDGETTVVRLYGANSVDIHIE